MQKTVVARSSDRMETEPGTGSLGDDNWRDLEQIARVEVTSEDPIFAIEGALTLAGGAGWRASEPGAQRIGLFFAKPISLRRIQLRFEERERERTQQFTLRSIDSDGRSNEITRQQWNFSPSGSTTEIEDLAVNLSSVSGLELTIAPDISGGDAVATLASLRLL